MCGSCVVHMGFSCDAAISGLSLYGPALGSSGGAVVCVASCQVVQLRFSW